MKAERRMAAAGLSLIAAAALMAGCAGPSKTTGTAPHPPTAASAAAQGQMPQVLAGKVAETMDASGYTYILLDQAGEKKWVAVPVMKVAVGEEVRLAPGMVMTNFNSKALDKTFEQIIFSSGPAAAAAPAGELPPGHPSVAETPQKAPVAAPAKEGAAAEKPAKKKGGHAQAFGLPTGENSGNLTGKVVETMNGGGYTYICIEADGKKTWAAVPPAQVAVGDTVEVLPGMEMGKFTSKTLNRTFDSIIFSGGIVEKK